PRLEFGLRDEELLLVHTSSEARWEAFDHVLAFFDTVSRRRPARLLFVTTLSASEVARRAGRPLPQGALVQRVEGQRIGQLLSAGDVGLLLRHPHDAHRYASPIKFAEYLAAGLPPVVRHRIPSTPHS